MPDSPPIDPNRQRRCDFCDESTAILYCRADNAKLCLSCDREVHSTNPLFTKHTRSLLCDGCDSSPASIFCSTDAVVHCQNCDWESHNKSNSNNSNSNNLNSHDRRPIEGFSGCPSVADLLSILGFEDLGKKGLLSSSGGGGGDGGSECYGSGDGFSDYLVWETPTFVSLDDLIVSGGGDHSYQAMGVPPLPKVMASSSRQDTASLRVSNHPWLQFRRGSDEYKRLQKLLDKEFEPSRSISWSLLRDVGEFTRARDMMNEPWRRFFAISGPQYKELCLEFFSTFNFDSNNHNYSDTDAISFVLGGVPRNYSVADFGVLMGLYTVQETHQSDFLDGLTQFPEDYNDEIFWEEIGDGQYIPNNKTKATRMNDPLYRYLHRVIGHTIAGRRMTSGGVTKKDLFFLFCLIKRRPCNLAYMLADYFTSCTGSKKTGHICGGTYVTRLAESLHIITPDNVASLNGPVLMSGFVDREHLIRMDMIADYPQVRWRFKHNNQMWIPPYQDPPDDM